MSVPVDMIRKQASLERGRRAFESYGEGQVDIVGSVRLAKMAFADPELLSIASWCSVGDTFDMYEVLGGEFTKEAISPAFVSKAVKGAVSKGVSPERLAKFQSKMQGGAKTLHRQMTARGPGQVKQPGLLDKLMGQKATTTPGARLHERGSKMWKQKQRQMSARQSGAGAAQRALQGDLPSRAPARAATAATPARAAAKSSTHLPTALPALHAVA